VSTAAQFTGEIPAYYDRCLGPVMFEPYAEDLVARVPARDGLRVLELACGTGIVTRRLRGALPPSAAITATDLNAAMLDHARAAQDGGPVTWERADAAALPFADGAFEVVLCQFGLMFLPDRVAGFAEARRVLEAGGVLLASVWRAAAENPYAHAASELLARRFPADPPRFLQTPFGYHDPELLRADAAAGGFAQIELDDVRLEGVAESAELMAQGFVRGSPLSAELLARGCDLDELAAELAAELARIGGARPFRTALAATVISARS